VASHTLDAAGNLKTRTDSRGVTATYSHDALNRITRVVYAQGAQSQTFSWNYDQTGAGFSNGIGRLTSTQFPGGASSFSYDPQGRLITTVQTVVAATTVTLAVTYGYDAAGHITSITYPSGRVLYIPHAGGQPTSLSLAPNAGSAALPLMSGLQFEPGPGGPGALRSWNWELNGGALPHSRVFDVYGRMVRHPLGGAVRDITYDAADRITGFTHLDAASGQATTATQALNQGFSYDEPGRLTGVTTAAGSWGIAYDDNGNRTLMTATVNGTNANRTYAVDAASNRLLGLSNPTRNLAYDAMGNVTRSQEGITDWNAIHDLSGRISRLQATGAAGTLDVSYGHDGNGLRLWKLRAAQGTAGEGTGSPIRNCVTVRTVLGETLSCNFNAAPSPTAMTVYVYGPDGLMLGEYNGTTGAVLREYVWLQDMPAAAVDGQPGATSVYYIQTDHLNTPRVMLDRAGRQRWSWVAEPFGVNAPVENPLGFGAVKLNLRMPGQYFDEESGLSYNWNRSYDGGVGRYTQSDPIGLAGGINTYAYVGSNPLNFVDPTGLVKWSGESYQAGLVDMFGLTFTVLGKV
jgi:RHS repeat-associated protein